MPSRVAVAVAGLGVLGSVVLLGSTAGASVTKGDPQPELKPYTISSSDDGGGGGVAILGNGSLLAAYTVKTANGHGAVKVCRLSRASTPCASDSPTIDPPAGATNDTGEPQIFVANKTDVYLLVNDSNSGAELYTSTNSGVTFSAPVSLGQHGVSSAALLGDNLIFSPGGGLDGSTVASVNVDDPIAPPSIAAPSSAESSSIGDGSYKDGALVVNNAFGEVIVDYAPSGKDFNVTSSYGHVGTFANDDFEGISGSALLTESTSGSDPVQLRLFNGTSFSAAHTVPKAEGAGPEAYVVVQDPASADTVHVFTILAKNGYELDEESTVNGGATWTAPAALSDAEASSTFVGGLDANGSGIILGTDASDTAAKAIAYPVLALQHVTLALNHAAVDRTKKVIASGKSTPIAKGRTITLEVLKKGLWHSVATTKETATGHFSFTLKDETVGSFHYRAVGADTKGFVEFGYSGSHALDVKKVKKT